MSDSMTGYTKLFNSILASTIWREDDKTRIVWITLLAMANKDGVVEASLPGLADFARVTVPDCRQAIERLAAPDEDSRSKVEDGRRIKPVEGGWLLINHAAYRAKLSQDERREYNRVKQAEHRAKVKESSASVKSVIDESALSAHTEAKAEAEAKAKNKYTRTKRASRPSGGSSSSDPYTAWKCPHTPPCDVRWACGRKTQMQAVK